MAKAIEAINRRLSYSLLRLFFRNRPVEPPVDNASIKKILLLRYDAIGDMIVTTPVIGLLRQRFPKAIIHVVASHRNKSIIRFDPRLDHVFTFDGSFRSFRQLRYETQHEQYDCVFSFVLHRTTLAGMIANMIARQAIKITVRHEQRAELYSTFFNMQLPMERDRHTMGELQTKLVCDTFGWSYHPSLVSLDLFLSEEQRKKADAFLTTCGDGPLIVLNLSSGNSFRTWPLDSNRCWIASVLTAHPHLRFILLAAPADAAIAEELQQCFPEQAFSFPPTPDILDVCALIEKVDMVVTPDTSVVHIAAAFHKPVVVLYSRMASFIREWMPFGVPYRAVVTKERAPLETIPVEEVVQAFEELYQQTIAVSGIRVNGRDT